MRRFTSVNPVSLDDAVSRLDTSVAEHRDERAAVVGAEAALHHERGAQERGEEDHERGEAHVPRAVGGVRVGDPRRAADREREDSGG